MRRKVIAGNWKMNMTPEETVEFIQKLAPLVKDAEAEVVLCVPFVCLESAVKAASRHKY